MSEIKVEKQVPDNFTMVYNHCLEKLDNVYDISVYVCLSKFADYGDKTSFPSYQTIADKIGCSRNKVISSVKNLVKLGLVTKKKRRMQTSIYTIIHPMNLKTELVHEVNSKGTQGEPLVVHEVGTNDTHLTKPTSNNNQEGDKSPAPVPKKEIFFEDLTKDQFKRNGKSDPELVKRFVGAEIKKFSEKNPNKYPREFLEYFYNNFTYVNEHENKSKASEHLAKRGIPSIGQTLPNWFSRWKPQANGSNSNKCYAEQDFDFKRQNLMNNLAWVQEIKDRQNLEIYEGEPVGKIN